MRAGKIRYGKSITKTFEYFLHFLFTVRNDKVYSCDFLTCFNTIKKKSGIYLLFTKRKSEKFNKNVIKLKLLHFTINYLTFSSKYPCNYLPYTIVTHVSRKNNPPSKFFKDYKGRGHNRTHLKNTEIYSEDHKPCSYVTAGRLNKSSRTYQRAALRVVFRRFSNFTRPQPPSGMVTISVREYNTYPEFTHARWVGVALDATGTGWNFSQKTEPDRTQIVRTIKKKKKKTRLSARILFWFTHTHTHTHTETQVGGHVKTIVTGVMKKSYENKKNLKK